MADSLPAAAIAVLVLCGIALLIVIVMVTYCWWKRSVAGGARDGSEAGYAGFGQQSGSRVVCLQPSPGRYEGPIDINCRADGTGYTHFFVHITCGNQKEAGFTKFVEPIMLTVAGTYTFNVFAVTDDGDETPIETYEYVIVSKNNGVGLTPPPGTYTVPLTIDAGNAFRAGAYVAASPTFPVVGKDGKVTLDVSGVHALLVGSNHFDAEKGPARYVYRLLPQQPIVVPGSGSEITDSTTIAIQAAIPEIDPGTVYRYSVDGSYPTVPYNGPFFPPAAVIASGGRIEFSVNAIAVGRDGTTSGIVTAAYTVLSSGCAVFDPNVPEPTCVVAALDPFITFEHPLLAEGKAVAIFYAMGDFDDAKQWRVGERLAPPGAALMQLRAWAVDLATGLRSQEAVYLGSRTTLERPSASKKSSKSGSGGGKSKKSAQPMAPAGAAADRVAATNVEGQAASAADMVPPSIVCGCTGVHVQFDPSPGDEYVLRYTLNGTEPDENSAHYTEGSSVDVSSEVLMNGGQVYVVARYYIRDDPRPGQPLHIAPVTRFGKCFSRLFSVTG